VAAWFWYAVVAAVLYGAHQIFTRLAADRIGEGLGGFVVEASAALSILIYLLILWCAGRWNQKFSGAGFNYSLLTGICVPPSLLAARPSWRSQALCFSMKHHRGSGSPELRLQLQDCFCCANKTALGTQDLT